MEKKLNQEIEKTKNIIGDVDFKNLEKEISKKLGIEIKLTTDSEEGEFILQSQELINIFDYTGIQTQFDSLILENINTEDIGYISNLTTKIFSIELNFSWVYKDTSKINDLQKFLIAKFDFIGKKWTVNYFNENSNSYQ